MNIRIATRKSELALWQANHVADLLGQQVGVESVELVPLSTRGDEVLDRSLQKIGGKGLFIKELEVAMQEGRADIAVHSMKDVPVEMPEGFCIGAVLPRGNAADAMVGRTINELDEGAAVGTSSQRRAAQLKILRPDVEIRALRGNVNTRLAKLDDGEFDAIILAAAGLERLGREDRITELFVPGDMLPAAAQGVIGIECLTDNVELRALLAGVNDATTLRTTMAERTVANAMGADCHAPVAVYGVIMASVLTLTALVATPDGSTYLRESEGGPADDAEKIAAELARRLIDKGAADILAASGTNDV